MPNIKKRFTTKWIKAVAATYGRKVGEIGYMFVDDESILQTNREYLGHDYYTDIITFDYDEDDAAASPCPGRRNSSKASSRICSMSSSLPSRRTDMYSAMSG